MSKAVDRKTKNQYIEIARDLCYGWDVIAKIDAAKTEFEITSILADARKGVYDGKDGESSGT